MLHIRDAKTINNSFRRNEQEEKIMDRLFAIATLIAIVYGLYWVGRFIYVMATAPRGSLVKALAEADYDRAADDARNPILRDRRFAEARGDYLS